MSFLPEVREVTPFGRWDQFYKFLRNAGFYVTAKSLFDP